MKVELAEKIGFCFGVKKAVDMANELAEKGEKIYTYGPIIHNEQVVKSLMDKGVKPIDSLSDLTPEEIREGGSIIIRSHGVGADVYEEIEKLGFKIVDATCPFVRRIHKTVNEQGKSGRDIVIIGNDGHAEVEGIKGWCVGPVYVVGSKEDIDALDGRISNKICLVSQTTYNSKKFKELVEIFTQKLYDIIVVNTICTATEERQNAAETLASQSDAMLVIGGSHSSNTRKLYEICSGRCKHTYYIQTLEDLNFEFPADVKTVGITAGASTPNNIIEEVQNYVRCKF